VQVGEEIAFVARVTRYEKGYKGYGEDVFAALPWTDYRLSSPTDVRRVEARQHPRETRTV
jgi:NADPH-dependent curcumin reductase CurA